MRTQDPRFGYRIARLPLAVGACYRVSQRHGEQPAGEGEMRFGFFDQLPCASGFTEQQRYRDIMAQIVLADELGFDTVWLGELHFSRTFSILADPLMVLAAGGPGRAPFCPGPAGERLALH